MMTPARARVRSASPASLARMVALAFTMIGAALPAYAQDFQLVAKGA
ncbi:hypothetical protein HA066_24960, partial [Escherichia coli]|nr:hypothetical protein [Escherichia coli]